MSQFRLFVGQKSATGGGTTHSASGDIVAGLASVSGEATHIAVHLATGGLVAGSGSISGEAGHIGWGVTHTVEGALIGGSAAITGAARRAIKGVALTLYSGAAAQANIAGITALWWDAEAPDNGAPDYYTATEATDGSGVLSIDLSAVTTLDVGANGFLLLYKADGTDYKDSLVFAGQAPVSDIG